MVILRAVSMGMNFILLFKTHWLIAIPTESHGPSALPRRSCGYGYDDLSSRQYTHFYQSNSESAKISVESPVSLDRGVTIQTVYVAACSQHDPGLAFSTVAPECHGRTKGLEVLLGLLF